MAWLSVLSFYFCTCYVRFLNTMIFIIVETFLIFMLSLIESVYFACRILGVRESIVTSNCLFQNLVRAGRVCLPWRNLVSLTSRIWKTTVYNEPAQRKWTFLSFLCNSWETWTLLNYIYPSEIRRLIGTYRGICMWELTEHHTKCIVPLQYSLYATQHMMRSIKNLMPKLARDDNLFWLQVTVRLEDRIIILDFQDGEKYTNELKPHSL